MAVSPPETSATEAWSAVCPGVGRKVTPGASSRSPSTSSSWPPLRQRREVVGEVGAARALVRVAGGLVFARLHEVARVREGGDGRAVARDRVPAAVVGVQVRVDHVCDVAGGHAQRRQLVQQVAVVAREDTLAHGPRELRAHARFHQHHVAVAAHEHAVQGEGDAVFGVDQVAAHHRFPEHARHQPEDGPAVEPDVPVGNHGDVECAHAVAGRRHARNGTRRAAPPPDGALRRVPPPPPSRRRRWPPRSGRPRGRAW